MVSENVEVARQWGTSGTLERHRPLAVTSVQLFHWLKLFSSTVRFVLLPLCSFVATKLGSSPCIFDGLREELLAGGAASTPYNHQPISLSLCWCILSVGKFPGISIVNMDLRYVRYYLLLRTLGVVSVTFGENQDQLPQLDYATVVLL